MADGAARGDALELDPRRESAGSGRRFVRERLRRWRCPDIVLERSVIAAGELLANAILHAATPLCLEVVYADGVARISVRDHSPTMPAPRPGGADAPTGRGLDLVANVSRAWGIDPAEGGKVVWADIDDAPDPGRLAGGSGFPIADRTRDRPERPLRLSAVPIGGFLRMYAQHEAVLRELELVTLEPDAAADLPQASRIVALGRQVAPTREAMRRSVQAAGRRGTATSDVDVPLAPADVRRLLEWAHAMIEADELCRAGVLLAPPATPEVVAVRLLLICGCERYLAQEAEQGRD